jgi:hypothetical protein
MTNLSTAQADLLNSFVAANPDKPTFERSDLFKFAEENSIGGSTAYTLMKRLPRAAEFIKCRYLL